MKTIKKYKATSPGFRHRITIKQDLWKLGPYKSLSKGITKTGGRNNKGRITIRHRGGGAKRKYRIIDWKRNNGLYSIAEVVRIEYDPMRTGNIALCKTLTGKYFYILAPESLKGGEKIKGRYSKSRTSGSLTIGSSEELGNIPMGTKIYNVELEPGRGGKIARSAGTACFLIKNVGEESIIRLPSNKIKILSSKCVASIGEVSNKNHSLRSLGKAGASRWLGRRPVVRGEAMNPIDHPHGGKTHGTGGLNAQPRTKWGKLAKWRKTRKNKK